MPMDQKVGQEVELSAENKWTHTFADLDEKQMETPSLIQ